MSNIMDDIYKLMDDIYKHIYISSIIYIYVYEWLEEVWGSRIVQSAMQAILEAW